VRFWDSSAIVPLVFDEPASAIVRSLLDEDSAIAVWWLTDVECASALARKERERKLPSDSLDTAANHLRELAIQWHEIEPTSELRELAKRLLRSYPLRAGDAAQLAAAVILAENLPASLAFVSLDQRLRDAAAREGFTRVLPHPMS